MSDSSESLLSFIVPVHEPELDLFNKVLKALCVQSLRKWEAVFVLDGPCPEAKRAIAKAFVKVTNRFEILEVPHGGAQKARNAGLPLARGNYVVFWDSDCVIEPHTALAWVELMDKDPKIGFVYSGYSFLNEQGAIKSEPFDPWLLRVRNYISTCFPLRREFCHKWNEGLESLQDWDWWLGVVERGAVGKFLQGYAFSTAYPTPKSISGKGCTPANWLDRVDKVKALHGIPIQDVCLTSLYDRLDAISIAKAIGADYDDHPNDKPNHYKTIIQIGFSLKPGEMEQCASAWGNQHKKVIFWTADDVEVAYRENSKEALDEYAPKLNAIARQFVEDKRSQEIMKSCGFNTKILPLPVISKEEVQPLPANPKFMVDVGPTYGHVFNVIQEAIPDITLEALGGTQKIEDYSGLVCFRTKYGLLRPSVKRVLAAGRHVISNIPAPFAGCLSDRVSDAAFVKSFVDKIRQAVKTPPKIEAVRYYINKQRLEKFMEVVK